jgi:hypothetical protein
MPPIVAWVSDSQFVQDTFERIFINCVVTHPDRNGPSAL